MKRIYLLALLAGMVATFSPRTLAQVTISEFMADNKSTLADEDKEFSDWVELYNNGSSAVNLSGWALTDSITGTPKWTFPSTNIAAKGFLVVFASGKDRKIPGAPLHTDFGIRAAGEYLALLKPDGSVATEFSPAFPNQPAGYSYGTAQDVLTNRLVNAGDALRWHVPSDGSLGTTWRAKGFNDASWAEGRSGVGYQTAIPGFAVYNYMANVGVCSMDAAYSMISNPSQQRAVVAENAPMINYVNASGSAHYGNDTPFPGMSLAGDDDNFAVEATATITIPSAGFWTFGVNSDDGFALTIGGNYVDYPWPRGPGDTLAAFYFDQPGDYDLHLVFYECGGGAEIELFAAPDIRQNFDSSAFKLVGSPTGLAVRSLPVTGGAGGYQPFIATDLRGSMELVNPGVYLRVPFTVTNAASLQSLTLRMMYDDGFVAYLNGQEIARRNSPATPIWSSPASAAHPNNQAAVFEEINISDKLSFLQTGTNVLAIHAMNQSSADSDFLLVPELVEYVALGTSVKYFATPTPGFLNGVGFAAFVEDTKFSVDRGLYDTPFTVAITTATPGANIIYTTNGSLPALTNGLQYTAPIQVSRTTVLRAAAFKDGFVQSNPDTQTYLFLQDVIRQSPNGEAPPGWPSTWGSLTPNYGMDPDIVNSAAYSTKVIPALRSLPTFSIVTDLKNLFDGGIGIYANPGQDGVDWERAASVELIYPDGKEGFQVDAGLRIRGGYSRSGNNPKHGFRLLFRSRYGDPQLNFPLFAKQGGAETFDSFDLRTFQNYSWSFEGDYRFIGMRDQFCRDTQLAMGHQGERGDYYHLYINGHYWGIYNTAERPEASYAETYFGGREEDYDVVKVDTGLGYVMVATDGNLDAWHRLWRAATNGLASNTAYYSIQGRNPDGTPNPAIENLLDVDNLIDYMLLNFYVGNIDAPISAFLGNDRPNNVYCVRDRTGKHGGFRFFSHDGEHTLHHESTLDGDELHRDRTGPFSAGDPQYQGSSAFAYSNPHYIFNRLTQNTEFKNKLADRIHKFFFNGGVLTPEANRARFLVRSNEMYSAVVAESARWGDSKREPPRNRDGDWLTEVRRVHDSYMGQRTSIVLDQLKAKGWYPSVVAPTFSKHGGNVAPGFLVTITAPQATIYYTTDGTDPRAGTSPSATAKAYTSPVKLDASTVLKARVRNLNGTWSALNEAVFYVVQSFSGLLITEIMYNPLPGGTNDGDLFEFLELKNVNTTNIELSGLRFTNGINYVFPPGVTLAPGAFHVLVRDATLFTNRYPGTRIGGVYTNSLSNSGERLTLVHADGKPIFSVNYDTRLPWPPLADGDGFSLVSAAPNLNPAPDDARNWRASTIIGGSPGTDDPTPNLAPVYVNEVLSRSVAPHEDWIELYNPHGTNVNIAGWYLTDDRTTPRKYQFPSPSEIPAGGYLVITETQWKAQGGFAGGFALSSSGDEAYLYSATTNGTLTGYSHGFDFGAAREGVTFGRWVNSAGVENFPAQASATQGTTNSGPRREALVINEIHYKPAAGGDEFIELKSTTNSALALYHPLNPTNTWAVSGVRFSFPTNVQVPPNGLVLLVKTNPAAFRAKYGLDASVPVFGPYSGALQGGGERLTIQFPDAPVTNSDGSITVPYIDADSVRYDDAPPWPALADGLGASLERINANAYGDDPANWRASAAGPTPGMDDSGNHAPVVTAGPDVSLDSATYPAAVSLNGTVTDDNFPGTQTVTSQWHIVSGPAGAWFDDAAKAATTARFLAPGTYVLRLTASDGELQKSDELSVSITRNVTLSIRTLVPAGAIWKYLDNGSDQGVAWRGVAFNDSAWGSGPAPLGYSDANGVWPATTNSYGPVSTDKYITTYYRQAFVVNDPASLTNMLMAVQRDDGVLVSLNGVPVLTNNLPADIGYRTPASSVIGGSEETTFVQVALPATLLRQGTNVIAAEVHQSGPESTDVFFNLTMTTQSEPLNIAPSVNAGADATIEFPGQIRLNGVVTDDGLPRAGILAVAWSKVSGPGTVTFSHASLPGSSASFSAAGQYVLRLTAADGALTSTDDVSISAGVVVLEQPAFEEIVWVPGINPMVRLSFTAAANQTYTVQHSSAPSGPWTKLQDLPGQAQPSQVLITDPTPNANGRFYRIVTPAQ